MALINRGPVSKPVAATQVKSNTSASKSNFSPAAKGTKPGFLLKVQEEVGGEIRIVTGLFTAVTKNGEEYLSGKDRESGAKYFIMTNSPKVAE
jgi:hypothetical protein